MPDDTKSLIPQKPKSRKYQRTNQIDAAQLIRLRFHNKLSYEQIALQVECSKQNVEQRISQIIGNLPNSDEIEAHTNSFVPIMKGIRSVLSKEMIDPDKLKKATLGNVGYVLRNVNDIIRLEEGKSTNNVAYADMSRDVKEMDREITALESELGIAELSTDLGELSTGSQSDK